MVECKVLMILLNHVNSKEKISKHFLITYLKLLAPFAPHITEEIYQTLKPSQSIHTESWPEYDEALMQDDEINFVVSVNGKMRDVLKIPTDTSKEEIELISRSNEKISKYLVDTNGNLHNIKKTIFVKNKMINFVIEY